MKNIRSKAQEFLNQRRPRGQVTLGYDFLARHFAVLNLRGLELYLRRGSSPTEEQSRVFVESLKSGYEPVIGIELLEGCS